MLKVSHESPATHETSTLPRESVRAALQSRSLADEPESSCTTGYSPEREGDPRTLLSKREMEIVRLVAQGFRNREIADELSINEQTVKNHLHNVFSKTGVQDRLELALYAIYYELYIVH